MSSGRRVCTKNTMLDMLALGLEAVPEIASELSIPKAMVEGWLEELREEGLVRREFTPTYHLFHAKNKVYHRYRLANQAEA